jgi:WD40 repeat protein
MKSNEPSGRPEVYAIKRGRSGWTLSRRSLFGAAAAATAAAPKRAEAAVCAEWALAHNGGAYGVCISPDGRLLVSGGAGNSNPGDKLIKLWSLPDGALLKTIPTMFRDSLAISPDGRLLVSGCDDNSIKVWSLPDGVLLKSLSGHSTLGTSLAISPDGRLLASCGGGDGSGTGRNFDTAIKLWSLPDGALLKTIPGHPTAAVSSLAISPDGRLLAAGTPCATVNIRLWSLPDGALVKTFSGDSDLVGALAITPDGRLLASSSGNRNAISLWSLPDGALLRTIPATYGRLAIGPDGRLLASGSGKDIKLWSLPDGAALKSLSGHVDSVSSVAISPDGRLLASCGSYQDGTIRLWSLPDGKQLPVCLMDPAASDSSVKGTTYTMDGATRSAPCGTPIPSGAVCTCNCVKGTGCSCVGVSGGGGGGGGGGCSCIPVTYWHPN